MSTALASLFLIQMPGFSELLIIAGVVVLLFGSTKLPQLGKGLGEGIRNFKNGLTGSKGDKHEGDGKEKDTITKTEDH